MLVRKTWPLSRFEPQPLNKRAESLHTSSDFLQIKFIVNRTALKDIEMHGGGTYRDFISFASSDSYLWALQIPWVS